MSSSEAVSVTLMPDAGATEVVTGAVEAVVEDRVLMLPGKSSVEAAVTSAEGGSEAWGCGGSAEVDGGAGADDPGAADSGRAGVGAVGCSGATLTVTAGVSENKLTAGIGEKRGRLAEPRRSERLNSPVVASSSSREAWPEQSE